MLRLTCTGPSSRRRLQKVMLDAPTTDASAGSARDVPVRAQVAKPRWAFWKGMLVGAAIEVPISRLRCGYSRRLASANPSQHARA